MEQGNRQQSRRVTFRWLLPALILFAGFGATALTTYFIQQNLEARTREHFFEAVHQIEQTVQTRMEAYEGLLRGGAGLFAANRLVTLEQFRNFHDRLETDRSYPGVQGFGYSVRFPAEKLQAVIGLARQQGLTNFTVWPETPRAEYHSIIYLEPLNERNIAAIGYDMFTEPIRRAAMQAAWDSGKPAISAKVKLVQEIRGPEQSGFLIYMPVYLGGEVPATFEDRRRKLQGFVYSPFRAGDLFSAIVPAHLVPGIQFAVYDGNEASPRALLYDSDATSIRTALTAMRKINLPGRTWTLTFAALRPQNTPGGNSILMVVPALGGMATLLLVFFTWTEAKARERSEITAAALAESEELHRVISETAADGIVVIDEKSKVITANAAMETIFGYPVAELVGQSFLKLLPENAREAHQRAVREFLEGDGRRSPWTGVEIIGCHRDGHDIPLEISFGLARRGTRQLLTGLVRDITHRKAAERKLHETEESFALLVRLAEEYAIITMGPAGEINTWNPGAERTFGYTDREVIGRDASIFFTPEDRAASIPQRQLDAARDGGRVLDERWQVRKDGSRFWASGSLIALAAENGTLRGFAKILRDITTRKKAEESVRELNLELEERVQRRTAALQESKEQMQTFTYTVAHDLRAPLRAMQGFAHALAEDYSGTLDANARDYLERIMAAAQRMDELIQDLLAYSQLSRSELSLQSVNVREVVEAAITNEQSEIQRSEATVETTLEELFVRAHPATLEHALENLISNAIKFVKPGEKPHIHIRVMEQVGMVQISVQDHGIGISPEHQDRIFRVFERLHTQDAYPGTGIGLAIVKKAIERMDGRIGVISEAGQGSLFWIELPRANPHQPETQS